MVVDLKILNKKYLINFLQFQAWIWWRSSHLPWHEVRSNTSESRYRFHSIEVQRHNLQQIRESCSIFQSYFQFTANKWNLAEVRKEKQVKIQLKNKFKMLKLVQVIKTFNKFQTFTVSTL